MSSSSSSASTATGGALPPIVVAGLVGFTVVDEGIVTIDPMLPAPSFPPPAAAAPSSSSHQRQQSVDFNAPGAPSKTGSDSSLDRIAAHGPTNANPADLNELSSPAASHHPQRSVYPLEYPAEHYFARYFLNKEHYSFVGMNSAYGAFALSVIKEHQNNKTFYRSLLWTKQGVHHSYFLRPISASSQLQAVAAHVAKELGLDKHAFSNIQTVPKQQQAEFCAELLKLEEMFMPIRACIGVVDGTTCGPNASLDDMIASKTPAAEANQLLDQLGKRVNLAAMDPSLAKYAGLTHLGEPGLLNTVETVLTRMLGVDIVFHVSFLLPLDGKEGGLSRKRLIGNDIGVVVLLGKDGVFNPSDYLSKVNHIFIILQSHGVNAQMQPVFRLAVVYRDNVPKFGPTLSDSVLSWTNMRAYIIAKTLNGMHAARQNAPGFRREDVYLRQLEELQSRYSERMRSESVFVELMNTETAPASTEGAHYEFDMYNSNLDLSQGSSSTPGSVSSPLRMSSAGNVFNDFSSEANSPHRAMSPQASGADVSERGMRKSISTSKVEGALAAARRNASRENSGLSEAAKREEAEQPSMRKSISVSKLGPKDAGAAGGTGAKSKDGTPPRSPASTSAAVSFALEAVELVQADDDDVALPSISEDLQDMADLDDDRPHVTFGGWDIMSYDDEEAYHDATLGDLTRKLGDLDEEQRAYIYRMIDMESDVRANELLDDDFFSSMATLEHTTYVDLPPSSEGHGFAFEEGADHLFVVSVTPGGIAETAGLCKDDKLLSVNGVKVNESNVGTVGSLLQQEDTAFELLISRPLSLDADEAFQEANPVSTLVKAWLADKKDSIWSEKIVVGKNLLFEAAPPAVPANVRSRSNSTTASPRTSVTLMPPASPLSVTAEAAAPDSPGAAGSSVATMKSAPTDGHGNYLPVAGGTVNALIAHLTSANDPAFTDVFMQTYSSFTTNEILLKKLFQKYYQPSSSLALDGSSRTSFLVCNVLKKLITDHWDDLTGKEFLLLREFLVQAMAKKGSSGKGESAVMTLLVDTIKNYDRPRLLGLDLTDGHSGRANVLDFSAKDVARQITLRDSIVFRRVRVSELLGSAWSREDRQMTCPNLMALIKQFNEVSHWCSTSILNEPTASGRADVITKFIKLLKHLFSLNNFCSMIAIIAGLNSAGVCRLKSSFALVSKRLMASLVDLTTLMSSRGSYSKYRIFLSKVKGACVPYVGLYLQDLTFIEDGNPNKIGTAALPLINFTKRRQVFEVVDRIRNFQGQCNYKSIKPNAKILGMINGFKRMSEDEMYKLSLEREPKVSGTGRTSFSALTSNSH
ncbi:hypothetical protein CAOG_05436 [Capsaspora owczarzaki ATCC 30864]|uniref:Uncharacterized protein n=1 Tax=Capsaspora owczarzaki (strain ATCC 30864) TaxID=595528 RepID=A0A0D2WS13_CAPO3|nr:hypothetical protein CAOG_05436 [Capsaspora owczarzaki ATCC 30864]KJE94870.1 hypothetical protein, variant 1 [Capsaspora owczarzaki ATCC 30864]|eukprot:XP_004346109.1 hypothetical protein CAOG_05436 [Capsaspora owczarzaki ATCC 30864]